VNILFDLDGTLTDSGEGITRGLQHALARLGREAPPAPELRRFVGPPLHESLAELLGADGGALVDEAVRVYRERFETVGMFENRLYPGVGEGLEALSGAGHRLWVVTSKPTVYADRIVDLFGLRRWMQGVHGSELSGAYADKRRLVRRVLDAKRLEGSGTWMVGDRRHDVRGARDNGVSCIGVLWGYGSAAELEAAEPDHIVATMPELCEMIGWEVET
jgi:phosphoglycolate phosphatase